MSKNREVVAFELSISSISLFLLSSVFWKLLPAVCSGLIRPITQGLPLPTAARGARCKYFSSPEALCWGNSILGGPNQDDWDPFLLHPHSCSRNSGPRAASWECWGFQAGRDQLRITRLSHTPVPTSTAGVSLQESRYLPHLWLLVQCCKGSAWGNTDSRDKEPTG